MQYAQSGCIISNWELDYKAVQNEGCSYGIYFSTDDGVIHLSRHYIYVQNPRAGMKSELLFTGLCAE